PPSTQHGAERPLRISAGRQGASPYASTTIMSGTSKSREDLCRSGRGRRPLEGGEHTLPGYATGTQGGDDGRLLREQGWAACPAPPDRGSGPRDPADGRGGRV